jgi:hypothetical protein
MLVLAMQFSRGARSLQPGGRCDGPAMRSHLVHRAELEASEGALIAEKR